MDLTDARTRKKVTLNPRTVLSNSWVSLPALPAAHDNGTQYLTLHHRVSGRVATDIVFSNALLVVALWTTREWLLSQNVGAFWVLMRILACGALGLGLREVASGDAPKALEAASSAKVRTHALLFFFLPSVFAVLNGGQKVDRAGYGLRSLLCPTRQSPSGPVAVIGYPVCTGHTLSLTLLSRVWTFF